MSPWRAWEWEAEMRRLFVAGNWKMNTTLASAKSLAAEVAVEVQKNQPRVDVAVCPPAPYLLAVKEALGDSKVGLGAQNAYFASPGAYTGELAIEMLQDVGCQWVILGHSERRQHFGETDDLINKKIVAAASKELGVIFCVGESLADRQANKTEQVLETQLAGGFAGVDVGLLGQIVVAYEPVWAIGTGVTATPDQAQAAHLFIRGWLAKRYNSATAEEMRILYGGSVKADNAAELMGLADVDGALVGGASLKGDLFLPIIRAAAALAETK